MNQCLLFGCESCFVFFSSSPPALARKAGNRQEGSVVWLQGGGEFIFHVHCLRLELTCKVGEHLSLRCSSKTCCCSHLVVQLHRKGNMGAPSHVSSSMGLRLLCMLSWVPGLEGNTLAQLNALHLAYRDEELCSVNQYITDLPISILTSGMKY